MESPSARRMKIDEHTQDHPFPCTSVSPHAPCDFIHNYLSCAHSRSPQSPVQILDNAILMQLSRRPQDERYAAGPNQRAWRRRTALPPSTASACRAWKAPGRIRHGRPRKSRLRCRCMCPQTGGIPRNPAGHPLSYCSAA